MELIAKKHNIEWNDWLNALAKQPIDNSLPFEEIITNTIITAKTQG